ESRINASLPYDRRPGWATIIVSNKNGIDSDARFIKLECKECPEIRANAGVLDGITYLEEFHPSSVISIFGYKFSAKGNTITVRQIDDKNRMHSFILERDAVWYESPNQINVRLPAELLTRSYATVTVTDAQGRESNEYSIYVRPDCQDCLPIIRPHIGVISRDTNDETFYADSVLTVFGGRFSQRGNKLVVEQAGRKLTAQLNSQWSESPTQITAQLPNEVVPGRSLIYVVDAEGRESNATEIYIQRGSRTKRPPIRRTIGR
ncbi:MAG TPA: hypothetical protein VEF04_10205, partial [Blastocatellia bacterium]|nr:hypothetical protein [Blastocatellia bacterium]